MVANISVNSVTGKAEALFAGRPAWHGLGTVVAEAPDSAAAIKLAGMDWEVLQAPLYASFQELAVGVTPKKAPLAVPSHVLNVRSDTHEPLAVVTADYKPIQNRTAFDWTDSLVADKSVRYESCGCLAGGRVVWLLARMTKGMWEVGPDDAMESYLLFTTAHDGSRACRVKPTNVRVQCWNMLQMALKTGDEGLAIRHTGDLGRKLELAKEAVAIVSTQKTAFMQAAKLLAARTVTKKEVVEFYANLLPDPKTDEKAKSRFEGWAKEMDGIREGDPRCQGKTTRGTAWGLLNATTQWVDWQLPVRGKNDAARNESRMRGALMGFGAALKSRALDLSLKLLRPRAVA